MIKLRKKQGDNTEATRFVLYFATCGVIDFLYASVLLLAHAILLLETIFCFLFVF